MKKMKKLTNDERWKLLPRKAKKKSIENTRSIKYKGNLFVSLYFDRKYNKSENKRAKRLRSDRDKLQI